VACIKGEVNAITTVMRLNTRWSTKGRSAFSSKTNQKREDHALMAAFRRLNEYLEGHYDIDTVDCVMYVHPFQQVIVSELADGPLTIAALSALSKFALYGFLSRHYPHAADGIELIAGSVKGCVFEESTWQNDEVVMLKLLELSTMTYRCDASIHLSVSAAWDIYETCLSIRNQKRASCILQSEAETTLRHLTLTAFSRAHGALRQFRNHEQRHGHETSDLGFSDSVRGLSWEDASKQNMINTPVGVTLLLGKIMTVLSGLMNPQNDSLDRSGGGSGTKNTALEFALSLVNIALEAGGTSLSSIGPLVDVLRGDVCRHLLRATQSDDLATFSARYVFYSLGCDMVSLFLSSNERSS